MKVNKKRFLLFGIVIFLMYLMTSFVSAELNLVISANEKGEGETSVAKKLFPNVTY